MPTSIRWREGSTTEDELFKAAAAMDRSVNWIVNHAVEQWLKERKETKKGGDK